MTSKTDWAEANEAVRSAASILVVTHVKPDGDAIGSLLGMTQALREIGKKVDAAVDSGVPDFVRFLSGARTVKSKLKRGKWELLISVDASDEERTGLVGAYGRKHSAKVINLDHHPTNTLFGDVHLVVPTAVSATEIIYDWLLNLGLTISKPVATALLTGLITDTIGFRTSNVNPKTLGVAQQLMLAGAPFMEIINQTLVSKPFSTLNLWKQSFPSMQFQEGIISAVVTQENLKQAGLAEMTDGGLVSTLVAAEEASIAVVFKELPDNRVELSIRSKPGIDVGSVAFALGGGGHAQASGATVPGSVDEVRERVMPLLAVAAAQGVNHD
jgi:bifunctional oligoribonuclease and PAP phosphatase NrnA